MGNIEAQTDEKEQKTLKITKITCFPAQKTSRWSRNLNVSSQNLNFECVLRYQTQL